MTSGRLYGKDADQVVVDEIADEEMTRLSARLSHSYAGE